MGIKVIPRSVAVLQTGGQQLFVDIDHTEDSISLGDGTNTVTLQDVGGVKCLPVKPLGGGDASASNQTSGAQKTQITDSAMTDSAEIDDVGGEKALKVSVIASVGAAGGASATDESNFTAGTSLGAPIMGQYDADGSADLADGKIGMIRCNAERALHVLEQNPITGFATSAKQDTIIGHLDGVEGLLTTIDADTGAIATSVANIDTDCTTIIGHLDGVEGLLTTIDTDTGNIATSVANIDTDCTTIIGHLDGVEGILTTIDADTGSIMTAVQLIDDAIFVDDAAYTAATSKLMVIGGQYQSSPNALDDGDAGSILLDANHAVQVVVRAGTANIGDVDIASIAAGDNNIGNVDVVTLPAVAGAAAHDAAISGNPVPIGYRAKNTNPTSVADGDVTYGMTDLAGRQIMSFSDRALVTQAQGDIANTTEETVLSAGGANVFLDLTLLMITNSNTTTAAQVQIRDATAGTIRMEHMIPPNSGMVINFPVPFKQTTANNNWTIDLQASVSTVYYTMQAIQRLA